MKEYLVEMFNPILLVFGSYTAGIFGTWMLKSINLYSWFDNHNYISDNLTRRLGVLKFGWLIRHSFMGMFNPKLKFSGKLNKEKMIQLRDEMTLAEIGHLLAFVFLQALIFLLAYWNVETWQIVAYTISNIIFNLYLVFLQQFNKRRIDRILNSGS